MAEEDVVGGGVGSLNTGDSGVNDGTSGTGGDLNSGGGGGGAGGFTGTVSTSGTSGSSGSETTGSGTSGMSDAELVESVVKTYLEAAALTLTYEQLVPIYVDNKLGFAKLAKEYKEDNPDVDPDEIDTAVAEEKQAAIDSFNEDGSNAKIELQKKYDDFKSSMAEIKKSISSLPKEIAKTVGEAVMPTTIGLGGPNPLSIALKLFNGITKIKRILDAIFGALALFMTTAKALGLDNTDGYLAMMKFVATPLRLVQNIISKQESDAKYQENLAMENYLQTAKENWPYANDKDITYKDVEEFGRDGVINKKNNSSDKIVINTWPIEDPRDRNDILYTLQWYTDYYGDYDSSNSRAEAYDRVLNKYEAIITYSNYIGWAQKQFKDYYQKLLEESNSNNNTTSSSSSGTFTPTTFTPGGGSNDTSWKSNTYGLDGLDKKTTN